MSSKEGEGMFHQEGYSSPDKTHMTKEQYRYMVHGIKKEEILNTQADGHGGSDSFLTTRSGMSHTNPFKSDKQRKFLAINKPDVAHKFALHSKKK